MVTRANSALPYSAAKGCDGLIFNLVQDLQAAGIVNASLTGQTIAGGQILLRT